MIGRNAGCQNVSGTANIFIGDEVGKKTWTSKCNILIGTRIAACNQKNGEHTIAIGYEP